MSCGGRGVVGRRGRRVVVVCGCRGRSVTVGCACCTAAAMLCEACWCSVADRGSRVAGGGAGPGAGAAIGVWHRIVFVALRGSWLMDHGWWTGGRWLELRCLVGHGWRNVVIGTWMVSGILEVYERGWWVDFGWLMKKGW